MADFFNLLTKVPNSQKTLKLYIAGRYYLITLESVNGLPHLKKCLRRVLGAAEPRNWVAIMMVIRYSQ